jgi:hypothetical protein
MTPSNPGEFGTEVHLRVTQRLNGQNPRYRADVLLNRNTMQIVSVGSGGSGGGALVQIDVIALADGYSPEVGDTLDLNRVKMAFEIKTGIGGTVHEDQRIKYIDIFGEEKFRSINSRRRWTLGTGWNDTPKVTKLARGYNLLNSSATKTLRSTLPIAGAAVPLIALVDNGPITEEVERLDSLCRELLLIDPQSLDFDAQAIAVADKVRQIVVLMGADDVGGGAAFLTAFHTLYRED